MAVAVAVAGGKNSGCKKFGVPSEDKKSRWH
jgi:hypothetical protein